MTALWTTSWQAGVMAGAVWLICRQWPRMPANLRVVLWWLVCLKFVLGLVWTQPILLPVLPAAATATGTRPIGSSDLGADGNHSATSWLDATPRLDATSRLQRGAPPLRDQFKPLSLGEGFGDWVVPLWALGVLVQGALLMRQLVRTRRLIAGSLPVEGDATELFDDLVIRLGVTASQPRLRVSTAIGTPQVTGLTRPVILLPVGALESFSTRELSLTLCHELMHVKRFDLWHGWIPSIASRLFFFHPLARLAAHEYGVAREAACDAHVLAFMNAPAYDYGRLLMRLGVTARESAPAAAGASPTLHTLKRRLLMLHDASPHTRGISPRWWALAAIAVILVVPMRPTAAQRQPRPPQVAQHVPEGESWVFLKEGHNAEMHGSSADLSEAKRHRVQGEPMIWFKQGGRAYVLREHQLLNKARALFLPQEQLHQAMRVVEGRQLILRAQQDELLEQQDAVRVQLGDVERQVNEAAAATQKTFPPPARPSEEARRRMLDDLVQLELRLDEAKARRRDVATNQEVLAAQQAALGQQQAALGEEQAALGRQMEALSREVWTDMRALFDQALAAGAATPVK